MNKPYSFQLLRLTDKDFRIIQEYVQSFSGIKVENSKRVLLESRLSHRIRALQFDSYENYLEFVFGSQGSEERKHMMDVLTTNKTFFFREAEHFNALTQTVLPDLKKTTSHIKIWSAGASTGQELYTLGMVLEEYNRRQVSSISYRLLGTDLSYRVLQKAQQAIYEKDDCDTVPPEILQRYFMRSKTHPNLYKIVPELRRNIDFRQHNLMDNSYTFPESPFHIIFCRNVLIYFPLEIQKAVIKKLLNVLHPKGWLFLGHAESLMNIDLPIQQVQPSLYRKLSGTIIS